MLAVKEIRSTARSLETIAVRRAAKADYAAFVGLHRALSMNELSQGYADEIEVDWLATEKGAAYCKAILSGSGLGLLATAGDTQPQVVG